MANVFYPNFAIPSSANVMQPIWKLTRAMKKAGWNVVAHSDGITKTSAGTNSNDSWGTNVDPSLDVYPAAFDTAQAPWIVMSGPKTLKIPLSANPTGTLLRGEKITQATSSAEGELVGYVWSVPDSSGWAVVLPRTGTFNNSNIVTGATSGATFVPTGTIITYAREIMFGKPTANDTINGQIWYVCCDQVGESASLFSTLATSSGCTAIVPPGSGGTLNGFPSFGNTASPTGGAIAIRGTGGSLTSANWFGNSGIYVGNAQICCTNAITGAGVSADGSFYIAADTASASLGGFAYQRVDDGEPGDVDPYVFFHVTAGQDTTWVRTSNTSSGNSANCFSTAAIFGNTYPSASGYTARGVTVSSSIRDIACGYTASCYKSISNIVTIQDNASVPRTWNHPSASSPPIIRESILMFCKGNVTNGFHQYKGKLRWMFVNNGGSVLGTSDANTYFCVSSAVNSSQPSIYIGPYDGSSTPT